MIDAAEATLIGINLAAGGIGAAVLSASLSRMEPLRRRALGRGHTFLLLIALYLIECLALTSGMLTQIFTIALGFVWGWVLGRHFRNAASQTELSRIAFRVALYSCLPSLTLLAVPIVMAAAGWSVFTSEAGARLGIPRFLPWPANTIAGFFMAVATATVVLKTPITVATARATARRAHSVSAGV